MIAGEAACGRSLRQFRVPEIKAYAELAASLQSGCVAFRHFAFGARTFLVVHPVAREEGGQRQFRIDDQVSTSLRLAHHGNSVRPSTDGVVFSIGPIWPAATVAIRDMMRLLNYVSLATLAGRARLAMDYRYSGAWPGTGVEPVRPRLIAFSRPP